MSIACTCTFDRIGSLPETELVFVRSNDNFFDFDMSGTDLDAGDSIWFRVADRKADLTDADAEIVKTRVSGIVNVDAPNGIFQVQLEPADVDLGTLPDDAYLWECIIRKADVSMDTTLARGVARVTGT